MQRVISIFAGVLLFSLISQAQILPPTSKSASPTSDFKLPSFATAPDKNNTNEIPFAALQTFVDVFDAIKKNYVKNINDQTLMEDALSGMISRLDPHSSFMDAQQYEDFQKESEGDYAGIGVVLDIRDGSVKVISAVAGSPAAKAGIKSGDIINQIDGQNISGLNLSEINDLFTGDVGSTVTLLIQRGQDISSYQLNRETIHTSSITSRMLSNNIAYIDISQFQDDTAEALKKEIQSLQVKFPLSGLILDLRNNPGGLLDSAVDCADLFLTSGNIVSIKGRDEQNNESYDANPGDIIKGLPIVILVNNGTASAAEILTAALQDNHRAVVIGQQTYGKGSVQSIIQLDHGGAIKLTTQLYYTPNGKSIQAQGIIPQVILPSMKLTVQNDTNTSDDETEAKLDNHIQVNEPSAATEDVGNDMKLALSDFALYEALNIVKTMQIVAPK